MQRKIGPGKPHFKHGYAAEMASRRLSGTGYSLGRKDAVGSETGHAEEHGTEQVQRSMGHRPQIIPALQQQEGFGGKGGERRQAAEKAGHGKQPPFRRQPRMGGKETDS